MKDYSMNLEDKKRFILGYRVDGDTIIIKFAIGDDWKIPYNEKNEKILLNKMKKQLESSDEFISKKNSDINANEFWGFVSLCMSILFFLPCINSDALISAKICSLCLGLPSLSLSTICFANVLKIKSVISDFKRNKYFSNVEKKLNKEIRENQNMLCNVSNKTKKMIENTPEDKDVFNINSFNYVPYKDLEQIMSNIKCDEEFGFDYGNGTTSKTKKRVR